MLQVAPESKIQLISCELSPKYILGLYALEDIRAIDVYIFCEFLSYALFSNVLSISIDMYARVSDSLVFWWNFLSEVSSSRKFAIKWSSGPHLKDAFGFRPLRLLRLLLEFCGLKGGFLETFSFLLCLNFLGWVWTSTVTAPWLSKIWYLVISYGIVQIQIINL